MVVAEPCRQRAVGARPACDLAAWLGFQCVTILLESKSEMYLRVYMLMPIAASQKDDAHGICLWTYIARCTIASNLIFVYCSIYVMCNHLVQNCHLYSKPLLVFLRHRLDVGFQRNLCNLLQAHVL